MAREVLVVFHNHFDPTWRRCFDRAATRDGVTVRSYAQVERHVIDAWLGLAGKGFAFSEGQAVVWRRYLAGRGRARRRLQSLARAGRLDVMRAGETVQDTNLPSAEGLVRNFLVAQPLYASFVGPTHRGLRLGWLEDAFGNSANYPQVLRGVGADVACNLSYRPCPEPVWVGIDGTKIPCLDGYPQVFGGEFLKHPPCGACRGKGCPVCGGTGMELVCGFSEKEMRRVLTDAAGRDGDWSVAMFGTEEVLPDGRLLQVLREMNRAHAGRCRFRMANLTDIWNRVRAARLADAKKRDDRPTVDLNPAMPGCMVSRIRCKQLTRAAAYDLLAAEAALASRGWRRGKVMGVPSALTAAWQDVAFAQFHDAITGTHIDAANAELMDKLTSARAAARPWLPRPRPAPKGAWRRVNRAGVATLGQLEVAYDVHGLVGVTRGGADVFGVVPHYSRRHRPLRIGELVLEADFGDAWGQRIADFPRAERNATQVTLGDHHASVAACDGGLRWEGRYKGHDPKVRKLAWTVTVRPSADGQRLDFVVDVDWDTASRRLRAIVPVNASEATATYEIPFGFIDRAWDAALLNHTQWKSWTGEWPTLHWARKRIDARTGVAVLNRGLPCYRWMPGRFDLSLLRSPEWEFCAVETGSYEFWDIDGQRDAGSHRLEFSVWPYYEGLTETELTRAGYAYNLPAAIDPPFAVEGNVVVTAWKPAEDGRAWILRLQETAGKGTDVGVRFEGPRRVTVANLLEQAQGRESVTTRYTARLHRHGLLTLRIR